LEHWRFMQGCMDESCVMQTSKRSGRSGRTQRLQGPRRAPLGPIGANANGSKALAERRWSLPNASAVRWGVRGPRWRRGGSRGRGRAGGGRICPYNTSALSPLTVQQLHNANRPTHAGLRWQSVHAVHQREEATCLRSRTTRAT